MVAGIGMTRVMCAVPSESKVAESCGAAGVDCAAKAGAIAIAAMRCSAVIFIETVVSEERLQAKTNHRGRRGTQRILAPLCFSVSSVVKFLHQRVLPPFDHLLRDLLAQFDGVERL